MTSSAMALLSIDTHRLIAFHWGWPCRPCRCNCHPRNQIRYNPAAPSRLVDATAPAKLRQLVVDSLNTTTKIATGGVTAGLAGDLAVFLKTNNISAHRQYVQGAVQPGGSKAPAYQCHDILETAMHQHKHDRGREAAQHTDVSYTHHVTCHMTCHMTCLR